MVLQTEPSGSALRIAGTLLPLAVFFTVTAHVAARNVLGDVPVKNALVVGAMFAAIGFVFVTFQWPAPAGIALALLADVGVFRSLYGQTTRLAVYTTLIHVVVSIILGVVVFGLLALVQSAPG